MKKEYIVALLAALSVSACASTAQNRQPIPPVTCTAGKDCDAKWSRAVAWVSQNTAYKIQVQTDSLIQTYGPFDSKTGTAATVNKIAGANGQYEIVAHMSCDNLIGCIPDLGEQMRSFASFVNGG